MAPWLLIACGYPFSGKSTLAMRIADMIDCEIVSVDDLHTRHGVNIETDSVRDRDWLLAYKSAYQDTEHHLAEGRSVIFDSIGYMRKDRDRLRRLADRHESESLMIWLDVPVSVARQRLERNRSLRNRPNVPIGNFERIVSEFEPPSPDEAHITYGPASDHTEWVQQTLIPILESKVTRA